MHQSALKKRTFKQVAKAVETVETSKPANHWLQSCLHFFHIGSIANKVLFGTLHGGSFTNTHSCNNISVFCTLLTYYLRTPSQSNDLLVWQESRVTHSDRCQCLGTCSPRSFWCSGGVAGFDHRGYPPKSAVNGMEMDGVLSNTTRIQQWDSRHCFFAYSINLETSHPC